MKRHQGRVLLHISDELFAEFCRNLPNIEHLQIENYHTNFPDDFRINKIAGYFTSNALSPCSGRWRTPMALMLLRCHLSLVEETGVPGGNHPQQWVKTKIPQSWPGFEPGTSGLPVQRLNRWATLRALIHVNRQTAVPGR